MKILVFYAVMFFVAYCEEYSLEELDFKKLLSDDERRTQAFNCMMDRGPCGKMQILRDTIPEMAETKCARCTPKQKEKYDQLTKMLFEKYPKDYQELVAKYSPKSD